MLELNTIYLGDCLELMQQIETGTIDMILCDLPYTTKKRKITWNNWDNEIDLEALFKQYRRVIKENGAIVLFAMQPFASQLIACNYDQFKYEWIWEKEQGTGFLNAKRMPLRNHENILVFYKKPPTYNPQMVGDEIRKVKRSGNISKSVDYLCNFVEPAKSEYCGRYPVTIQYFKRDREKLHPTEKPKNLYKYLISTYTNENETVLDNCCGSGTIKVAETINRNYIAIEKDEKYFNIAVNRNIENEAS